MNIFIGIEINPGVVAVYNITMRKSIKIILY
jgi:hypothetical protein